MLNITRPTLIIDEQICRRNIHSMAEKAKHADVIFRPHFKTHQSLEVAEWFRDYGVEKITVSSAEMARAFAVGGWNDITIAFPANIREIDIYDELAAGINLNLLTDSIDATRALTRGMKNKAGVFIELDCGYGRSGIPGKEDQVMEQIVETLNNSQSLSFKGFLTHSGNTYTANSKPQIEDIYHHDIAILQKAKRKYISHHDKMIISIGDTPACSIVDDLSDADEIRIVKAEVPDK